jgi:hypothetical protein
MKTYLERNKHEMILSKLPHTRPCALPPAMSSGEGVLPIEVTVVGRDMGTKTYLNVHQEYHNLPPTAPTHPNLAYETLYGEAMPPFKYDYNEKPIFVPPCFDCSFSSSCDSYSILSILTRLYLREIDSS